MGTIVAAATTLAELRRGSGETLYDVPTLLPDMNCTRRVFTAVALQEICSQVGSDSLTAQKARFDSMFSGAKVDRPDQAHGIEPADGSEYVDIYLPRDARPLSAAAPLSAKLAAAAALGRLLLPDTRRYLPHLSIVDDPELLYAVGPRAPRLMTGNVRPGLMNSDSIRREYFMAAVGAVISEWCRERPDDGKEVLARFITTARAAYGRQYVIDPDEARQLQELEQKCGKNQLKEPELDVHIESFANA